MQIARVHGMLALFALPFYIAESAQGQQEQRERKLSAREIFYSAPKATAGAEAKPPSPPSVPSAPQAKKPPQTTPDQPKTTANTKAPAPPKAPRPPESSKEVQYIPASAENSPPLGIRCSVLKRVGPSDLIEVDPDLVFRSGERIRLRVEVNDEGYLYVVHRGSSGVWKPLFPSPEVADGANRVAPGRPYDVPPGHVFTFDEQPGEEKLFVVFSRKPVGDLEGLIYRLGNTPAGPESPRPAEAPKTLLAYNAVSIGDELVGRLRNAHARDLIIEKVDDKTPETGARAENAVYAVSAPGADEPRVVLDLSLMHR